MIINNDARVHRKRAQTIVPFDIAGEVVILHVNMREVHEIYDYDLKSGAEKEQGLLQA
jgi:hypothetical protein